MSVLEAQTPRSNASISPSRKTSASKDASNLQPTTASTRQHNTAAKNVTIPKATSAPVITAKQAATINWLTLEEAQKLNAKEKKKFIIDVYTDWCGWCKKMDATTFSNPEVISVINTYFYAIKLNAEQKEDIIFNGKTYKNKTDGTRSTHDLALELLKNRTSYPTTVFLDENLGLIQPIPGFLDAEKIAPILAYFQTNSYKNVPWEKFEKDFTMKKDRK